MSIEGRNSINQQPRFSKPLERLLHTPFFQQRVEDMRVSDALIESSKHLIEDIQEVQKLMYNREIEPRNFAEYVMSSPEFSGAVHATYEVAARLSENTPPE